nr:uncharacterized protein LOC117611947 [Osmia lignaria]
MKSILYASLCFCVLPELCSMEQMTFPIQELETTTPISESRTATKEEGEIEAVPMTEQVIDPDVRMTDVPDVDEPSEDWDAEWDKNKVIRDVAYYIRAHKFQDYDRRYYRRPEDSRGRLYEEFPKPPLRSLHWEVRKYCDASFVECLKYLEGVIKDTPLKREDDTVTIMKEQKWKVENNTKQIQAVQRDCQTAQRRDELTALPFQGPIERFQWRSTVSYYMCWYTMLGVPELSIFGESCDNYANCQMEHEGGNGDPRADDTQPYACALYSFCPDHCCPIRHIRDMTDCYQSPVNPCYAANPPEHRTCTLNRQENQDFFSLIGNQINISCECMESGYEWSSRFGLCVDVNECTRGEHSCSINDGEACMNMPGGYQCICKIGYVYDPGRRECVFSSTIHELLAGEKNETNVTETNNILEMVVKAITRSSDNSLRINYSILFLVMLMYFLATE